MFRKSKRFLAGFLAVLMAASAAQSFAFGAEIGENAGQAVTVQAEPQLQNGTAVIPEGSDKAAVNEILSKALIANYDQVGTQEWEYYCEGKDKTTGLAKNSAWGSIAGFSTGGRPVAWRACVRRASDRQRSGSGTRCARNAWGRARAGR